MAEVIGIVGSGISIATLAVQIAGTVVKLKSYWDEVKDAPEDIWLLMEELEELNMLLSTIRDNLQRDPMSNTIAAAIPASKCLDHCQRGARRLQELTEDLHADINTARGTKLRWASAKVVMKKDKIKRYKSRLESSIRLLTLSYQFYNRVLIQQQPDIIVARLIRQLNSSKSIEEPAVISSSLSASNQSSLCSQPAIENNETQLSLANNVDRTKCRRRERADRIQRLRIPLILINLVWEVELFRSRVGWTVNLRTINYVSSDSPIIQAIYQADLEMIKSLFKRGEASINDVAYHHETGFSSTLIGLAARRLNLPVFKFLLNKGAAPISGDVEHLLKDFYHKDYKTQENAVRLLINEYDIDFPVLSLAHFRGAEEAFLALRNQADTCYFDASFADRAFIAAKLSYHPKINGPDLFRLALQPGPILPADVQEDSGQLLHAVARAIGIVVRSRTYFLRWSRDDYINNLAEWRSILRELITKGADVNGTRAVPPFHKEEEYASLFQTPFLAFFGRVNFAFTASLRCKFDEILKIWLQDLQACGVNLFEYGSKEKAVHSQTSVVKHFGYYRFFPESYRRSLDQSWHIVDFTFGPSPSDWHVEIAKCPTEKCLAEYCCHTWTKRIKLEVKENPIPGAWIND